ncbi:MAG: VOC family protein [Myxococcales bacterium FL481]|nr:MAG: VOC family protein [Myxococcales bacterium FL481]
MPSVKPTSDITIALSVRDRRQSVEWYAKHFGFEVSATYDEMGWTELNTATPGVILGLGDMEEPKPGNCVPVFGVQDLDASRAVLEAADVRFDGDTVAVPGMTKIATLYDPDGNALMIAEDLTDGGAS